MSDWLHWASWAPLLAGLGFLAAGSLGLLRFPDAVSRLHALTKADTLGLGLIVLTSLCAVVGYAATALGWRLWIARKWRHRHAHSHGGNHI